jgi:hypothetical protein
MTKKDNDYSLSVPKMSFLESITPMLCVLSSTVVLIICFNIIFIWKRGRLQTLCNISLYVCIRMTLIRELVMR